MKKHYGGTLISQIKQLQDRVFNKILKEEGIYEFNGQLSMSTAKCRKTPIENVGYISKLSS